MDRAYLWSRSVRVAALGAALLCAAPAAAVDPKAAAKPEPGVPFHPSRVIVKMKPGVTALGMAAAAQGAGLQPVARIPRTAYEVLELVDAGKSVLQAIEELRASPTVELAEPDYVVFPDVLPNDPDFAQLWGLDQSNDVDIDAPEAWDITQGNPDVVVAVVDTGIDEDHPDLQANLWSNPDELPIANGIDDDRNGYVDDLHGINCIRGTGSPHDDDGHGTHVSGTIAAAAGNGIGVAGVSPRVRIMALKFLGRTGGYTSDAIECLTYALTMKTSRGQNLRVASNSWGGGGYSEALRATIAALGAADVLFVAAAGNDGTDNDALPHYPSSYGLPNVVSVAATDEQDLLASFSNFGAQSVDLAAPGVNILSTIPGDRYASYSGTSMATPHVSGAAALIASHVPGIDVAGMKNLLLANSDPVLSLSGRVASDGRLNAAGVLCSPGDFTFSLLPRNFRLGLYRDVTLVAALRDCGTPLPGASVRVTPSSGDPALWLEDDGAAPDDRAGDGVYSGTWRPATPGLVDLQGAASIPGAQLAASAVGEVVDVTKYALDDAEPFVWIDATAGRPLSIRSDDVGVRLAIGFAFPFYGGIHKTLTVSSNGYLTFGKSGRDYQNRPIPSAQAPDSLIAPYWDDLLPGDRGRAYTLRQGEKPDRRLTIEWREFGYYGAAGRVTFQVTLYERDGRIVFRYLDVATGSLAHARGASATVGIQNGGRDFAEVYATSQPSIDNGLAVEWSVDDSDVPASQTRVAGRRLSLRDVAGQPRSRTFDWNAADPDLLAPRVGGTSDPSRWGALLRVWNPGSGEQVLATLPPTGWRPTPSGYEFRGSGACTRVSLRSGTLRATCRGEAFGFSLDEAAQGAIAARLDLGSKTSFCGLFGGASGTGGEVVQDHGIGFGTRSNTGQFIAQDALAPALCPD